VVDYIHLVGTEKIYLKKGFKNMIKFPFPER
jgi:hypothetical protein